MRGTRPAARACSAQLRRCVGVIAGGGCVKHIAEMSMFRSSTECVDDEVDDEGEAQYAPTFLSGIVYIDIWN